MMLCLCIDEERSRDVLEEERVGAIPWRLDFAAVKAPSKRPGLYQLSVRVESNVASPPSFSEPLSDAPQVSATIP